MRSLGQIRLGADLFLFSIYQCIKGLSLKIQHTRWFFLKNGLLGSAARWKPKCVEKRSRLFSQQPISRHLGNSQSQSRDVFSSRHFCYWRKKCIKWKLLPALKGELDRYMRDDDNEENFFLRIRISAWLVFFRRPVFRLKFIGWVNLVVFFLCRANELQQQQLFLLELARFSYFSVKKA